LYARDKSRLEIAFVPPRAKKEMWERRRVVRVCEAVEHDRNGDAAGWIGVDVDVGVEVGVGAGCDRVVRRRISKSMKVGMLVRRVCKRSRAVRMGRI